MYPPADFNPRAPYGARRRLLVLAPLGRVISIHAPHTGRDCGLLPLAMRTEISILAPHTGRDNIFASIAAQRQHFNPRAPYGARRRAREVSGTFAEFQSTRPIRSATAIVYMMVRVISIFQSTRPIRSATSAFSWLMVVSRISIHAPHTERDSYSDSQHKTAKAISIHAPHTERDYGFFGVFPVCLIFQSTRPIRSATAKMHNLCSAFLQQQTVKA